MKVILPLAALALLSMLFLLSRSIGPTKTIPVAEVGLEQRAQEQGASNATFTGMTDEGDLITLSAQAARPYADDPSRILADVVESRLTLTSGSLIDILSDEADVNQDDSTIKMTGDVRINTSTGFHMTTDVLNTRFDSLYAQTPGPVTGNGPPGDLDAGRMVIAPNDETGDTHLFFTDGVKVIYQPKNAED
ncbi:lipopolysaccharide export system protein LptC [Roseovarius halotolerans]|uniref:Lipopolysaccharide-assembly, LptC-related n=2 Tax=Roseovarius halotolerans TaxID=505353 RepID=A0A1X6Z3R4_9RHOB|nr:LPS export ABC transporter periplasmic protein LptC [Roseovarius halotolerans]RKT32234.1 lipopolysaccharide export system protein LptC [Roseovarius halotolerans]SLN39965.1 Lipopolysaccharide-assembly, LptC-related [Roseovarius halotolerans]